LLYERKSSAVFAFSRLAGQAPSSLRILVIRDRALLYLMTFWTGGVAAATLLNWGPRWPAFEAQRPHRPVLLRPDTGPYRCRGTLIALPPLLFQGTGSSFAAYDARNGEKLWSVDTGVGVIAAPITYEINGVQYVAVMAGVGGSHGGHQVEFDYENHGQLLVFKRGGQAKMPMPQRKPARQVEAPPATASPDVVEQGRDLYARHCFYCHGFAAEASGLHPDLRYAKQEVHASRNDIVLGGTRQSRGMASFADQLSVEESDAVHAYVIERAHAADGWI
jgi:hypothetical protein